MYAAVGGPHECETNVNDSDYEWHVPADEEVYGGDQRQREEAIAEKANTLEEADGATEELSVQSDDGATEPHDHEDDLEEERLVIGLRTGREHPKYKTISID